MINSDSLIKKEKTKFDTYLVSFLKIIFHRVLISTARLDLMYCASACETGSRCARTLRNFYDKGMRNIDVLFSDACIVHSNWPDAEWHNLQTLHHIMLSTLIFDKICLLTTALPPISRREEKSE